MAKDSDKPEPAERPALRLVKTPNPIGRPEPAFPRPLLVVGAVAALAVVMLTWQVVLENRGDGDAHQASPGAGVIQVDNRDRPQSAGQTDSNRWAGGETNGPSSTGRAHVCLRDYPPEAVRNGEQGTTTLAFTITEEGATANIRVASSSGSPRLDAASMKCAAAWRYKPARKDGKPVAVPWKAKVQWLLH